MANSSMRDSKLDDLCQQFIAITGASMEIARNMLEASSGDLHRALNLHLEYSNYQSNSSTPFSTSSCHEEENPVRDPIPQTRGVLIQGSNFAQRTYNRKRKATTGTAFDHFRDYQEEAKIRELGDVSSNSKKRTLNDLFRPPIDLLHRGDFESARERCKAECKWLLVNIQDVKEFSCQVLNRDVWSDGTVRNIIQKNFVFWQMYQDSEEGYRYCQLYNVLTSPHVAVIDPRTGEKLLSLENVDARSFCEIITEFLSENPLSESCSKNNKKLEGSILDCTEESQLEAAIAASLRESHVNHKATDKNVEVVMLDSESDVELSRSDEDGNDQHDEKDNVDNGSHESQCKDPSLIVKSLDDKQQIDLTKCHNIISEDITNVTMKFLLRFPNGERNYASLPSNATVKDLLAFVQRLGYTVDEYELITTFPRRNISNLPLDSLLANNGLQGNDTIFVQLK